MCKKFFFNVVLNVWIQRRGYRRRASGIAIITTKKKIPPTDMSRIRQQSMAGNVCCRLSVAALNYSQRPFVERLAKSR